MQNQIQNTISSIIHKKINFIRLAGNSLIIYVNHEPGEMKGHTFWLDPTWHFRSSSKVLIGSRQVQIDDKEELDEIIKPFDSMVGREITNIFIEDITQDIQIHIDHEYVLKTFASDPSDDETWHIKDYERRVRIYGNPRKIEIEDIL